MRPRTTTGFAALACAFLLGLWGCPTVIPRKPLPPFTEAKPLAPTPDVLLQRELAALGEEALALMKDEHEALWAHWTQGVTLDLEKPALKHSVLFEDATLAKVRLAKSKKLGSAVGLERLEAWLLGERLGRASASASGALAVLESSTTFKLDGKEVPWRELGRLLANEKSAVKRRELWAASQAAVPKLSEGYRQRDEAISRAREAPEPDAEPAAALARGLLDDTEAEWKDLLAQLAHVQLGLPAEKLTRADLPRLLKPSTAADSLFPRQELAGKATALLAALGLYGLPGLTLDLAESTKKNPLPLTVTPGGAADVRVCFRPAGGVRDLGALLAELGRALALHESNEPAENLGSLAPPLLSDASAALFAGLVDAPVWLQDHGVSNADAVNAARSVRALRLFALRRAAGNLLAAQAARGHSEEAAAEAWRTWSARAVRIPVAPEEAARWRLESDPLGRTADLLQAYALAARWRASLPERWWNDPASGALLRARWAPGAAHGSLVPFDGGPPARVATTPDDGGSEPEAGPLGDAGQAPQPAKPAFLDGGR